MTVTPHDGVACDCITCGDEALPLRVVKVDGERGLALCENEDGARETVEIALVKPVVAGDGVLVHAGTAIARLLPEAEVGRTHEDAAGLAAPPR